MTPGARVAAAIEVLHEITQGTAAEAALTRWARRSRFAGSKDRAAIRDHVFDTLRIWRTATALGHGDTGRALMIGTLRAQAADLDTLFSGEGHAPDPLTDAERQQLVPGLSEAEIWNLPDWLIPHFKDSLGDTAGETAIALQARAPITLRVNLRKADRDQVRQALADAGVITEINTVAEAALTVTEGPRKIRQSDAFEDGDVEFQDASSQAVVAALPPGGRVLDYCAGGGGKALALSMDQSRTVVAHDIDPDRMVDLPIRAKRAGREIAQAMTPTLPTLDPFDVVLCDAPCSGSGAWRRAPEGKWRLTADRLAELNSIQDDILAKAALLVAPGGMLAYATCSVLACENHDRVATFLAQNTQWHCVWEQQFSVTADGDGFYTAHLTRV